MRISIVLPVVAALAAAGLSSPAAATALKGAPAANGGANIKPSANGIWCPNGVANARTSFASRSGPGVRMQDSVACNASSLPVAKPIAIPSKPPGGKPPVKPVGTSPSSLGMGAMGYGVKSSSMRSGGTLR